jgi:hypothetical protein
MPHGTRRRSLVAFLAATQLASWYQPPLFERTWTTPGTLPGGNATATDLDGDGVPEVVSAPMTFFAERGLSVAGEPFALVQGFASGGPTLSTLPFTTQGAPTQPLDPPRPLGDIDGDGRPELGWTLLVWNGASWDERSVVGHFDGAALVEDDSWLGPTLTVHSHSRDQGPWGVGDVDADGFDDAVHLDWSWSPERVEAQLWLGSPQGQRRHATWSWQFDGPEEVDVSIHPLGDVHGDGFADFALSARWVHTVDTTNLTPFTLEVFDGAAAGPSVSPSLQVHFDQSLHPGSLPVLRDVDLDGDGFDELVYYAGENSLRLHVHRGGPAGLSEQPDQQLSVQSMNPFTSRFLTSGDFNGDGLDDVVVGNVLNQGPSGGREIRLFLSDGVGLPNRASVVWQGPTDQTEFGEYLTLADLDGDGLDDLVASDTIRVLLDPDPASSGFGAVRSPGGMRVFRAFADRDFDGSWDDDDCAPLDPRIHPAADDLWYDGADANCDGADDFDQDGDGIYPDTLIESGDCDDRDPNVYPGAPDAWYDGVDSNCDGVDDHDQDGDGVQAWPAQNDCDDLDPAVHEGTPEVDDDGVDNDCDGTIDDAESTSLPEPGEGCACGQRGGLGALWWPTLALLAARRRRRYDRGT